MSNNIKVPIVVDLGTSEIKGGFSGQEIPKFCFPNYSLISYREYISSFIFYLVSQIMILNLISTSYSVRNMHIVHTDMKNVPYVPSAVCMRFQSNIPVVVNFMLIVASSTIVTMSIAIRSNLFTLHLLWLTAIPR